MAIGLLFACLLLPACSRAESVPSEVVTYETGAHVLQGRLYRPKGAGPFRAVLYNHGSAGGMLNDQAFDAVAPLFVKRGWVFFAPYRRGQGLSAAAGPYIVDELAAARARGGMEERATTMARLLATDHLDDQIAALAWLRSQPFVRADRIAVMGNSFGGIETVLGAAHGGYCAAVDASGGAESWAEGPALRELMIRSVQAAKAPVFFLQAGNDYSLEPTRTLFAAMQAAQRPALQKIYPAYGSSPAAGHSFAWHGVDIWGADVIAFVEKNCPN